MIALDASVIIAFLNGSDVHHDRAAELIDAGLDGGFTMHRMTIAEVLVGAVRQKRGTQLLRELEALGVTQTAPENPIALAELRASTGLRMPDCCVLEAALQAAAPLATFDSSLARAAARLGLEVLG